MALVVVAWLLGSAPGFAATNYQASQAGGVSSVFDRSGNQLTVSNRTDGNSAYIQITSYGRNQNVNWSRSHSDGYDERSTFVYVDASGGLIIVGARVVQGVRYLWAMKYTANGDLAWERVDSASGCIAFDVMSNENGDIWAAGSCIDGGRYPIRVMRIDANGNVRWGQSFDEGGRNYVRGLTVDFAERAAVTLEVSAGAGTYVRSVVFSPDGGRVATY